MIQERFGEEKVSFRGMYMRSIADISKLCDIARFSSSLKYRVRYVFCNPNPF